MSEKKAKTGKKVQVGKKIQPEKSNQKTPAAPNLFDVIDSQALWGDCAIKPPVAAATHSTMRRKNTRKVQDDSLAATTNEPAAANLTEKELATHPLLTVHDLAAYARHEATLEQLSETVRSRASQQYQQALASLKKSLGANGQKLNQVELYELADIAVTTLSQTQKKANKKRATSDKKKSADSPRQKQTTKRKTTSRAAATQNDSEPAHRTKTRMKTASTDVTKTETAHQQTLRQYNAEDRLENVPLKKYLPEPATRAIKTNLGLTTVGQLLEYFPRKYLPRGELSSFAELIEGQEVTIIARVLNVTTRTMAARRGRITEITITDTLNNAERDNQPPHSPQTTASNPRITGLAVPGAPLNPTGYSDSYGQSLLGSPTGALVIGSTMKLSFFNAWTAARDIHEGDHVMFSGKVGTWRGEYTLTNPHYAVLSDTSEAVDDAKEQAGAPIPIYRAPAKLPTDRIAAYITQLLEAAPLKELEDPVPYKLRRNRKLPPLEWTYRALHTPDSDATRYAAEHQMRYREAFVLQSALARLQAARASQATPARPAHSGGLADTLLTVLPYQLTEGQQKVGEQIAADLSACSPMNRLLQGDVGSGKTVVALRAMLQVADAGGQSAMLAPTEVLAEQHYRSILNILGQMADTGGLAGLDTPDLSAQPVDKNTPRVRVRLLNASMPAQRKKEALAELSDGSAQIVIGTHALLSEAVTFSDLGLVVVDEQHRFGVEQRDSLRGSGGELPHRLVMTATPIPRTVAMTVFGDLDVSVLDQLPAGRQKISTHVVPLAEKPAWASRLWSRAREEIDAGHQVYVVVPKIGEDRDALEEDAQLFGDGGREGSLGSDGKTRLTSVVAMKTYLEENPALAGVRVGTLHGRMDAAEKTRAMTAFERGEIDLLVSTTVVEVGVNVPNATLMIIMDADRFGISGLHQLRGRVGRGQFAGTCLLVTRQQEGGISRERLEAVAGTTDGFELSRIDLQQRREGDILGAAQSGRKSTLKFLRALSDAKIIEQAREDARAVVAADPTLAQHPDLARTIDRALDADREAFLGRG